MLQPRPPSDFASRLWRALASPALAAVLAMLFWAGTTIIVRGLRGEAPPMALAFWRNVAAFAMVAPFAWPKLRAQWPLVRKSLPLMALLSVLLWVGGNAILFLALQSTLAINAGVINSVEPAMIVALAALVFRDPLSKLQGLGVVVSLLGVLFLITSGAPTRLMALDFNKADLMLLAAYLSWACYAVLIRKLPRGLDGMVMLAMLLGLGCFALAPLWAFEVAQKGPPPITLANVGAAVGLALFSSVLAMMMWNRAIHQLGAIRASQFLHLIPAFTVLFAIALLGERLQWFHLVGIGLIVCGLWLTARR